MNPMTFSKFLELLAVAKKNRLKAFMFNNNYSFSYITRIVFVNPEPCCHPVTTQIGSPAFKKPLAFPNLTPNWTRLSTSFNQSGFVCSASNYI